MLRKCNGPHYGWGQFYNVRSREHNTHGKRVSSTSTKFSTNSHQDTKPTQPEHGGDDGFNPKREIVPHGFVEPLVIEKDDEGGEDAEEVHDRHHLLG